MNKSIEGTKEQKVEPKPLTLMRRMVKLAIKNYKACGHNIYLLKVIYPAHSHTFNGVNEGTADFQIVDNTRGLLINLKCDGRETLEDIMVYILNYKKRPLKRTDYNYLMFTHSHVED